MKRILIDSHVLLWILYEPEKVGEEATRIIKEAHEVLVSLASIFELTLKHKKGKLGVSPTKLMRNINGMGAELLSLNEQHILGITDIKPMTNDPFDILLTSQAKIEGALFVTADKLIIKSNLDNVLDAKH